MYIWFVFGCIIAKLPNCGGYSSLIFLLAMLGTSEIWRQLSYRAKAVSSPFSGTSCTSSFATAADFVSRQWLGCSTMQVLRDSGAIRPEVTDWFFSSTAQLNGRPLSW